MHLIDKPETILIILAKINQGNLNRLSLQNVQKRIRAINHSRNTYCWLIMQQCLKTPAHNLAIISNGQV